METNRGAKYSFTHT